MTPARLTLILLPLLLTACKTMTPDAERRAYCNQLKSDIVFNSATGITREANIQASQAPLQNQSFNAADCDNFNAINSNIAPPVIRN